MRRDEAIVRTRTALAREHQPEESRFSGAQSGHQAIALVDALEALGILKFDPPVTAAEVVAGRLMCGPTPETPMRAAHEIIATLAQAGFVIVPKGK